MLRKLKLTSLFTAVNSQILSSMIVVTVMAGLASVAGIGRELAIANEFGTASVLDAFLVGLVVPMFAVSVLANAFAGAIVPTYIQVGEREGKDAARRLFATSLLLGISLLIGADVVLAAVGPWLISGVGIGFDAATLGLSLELYYWLLPVLVLTGVRDLYTAAVNAGMRFGPPALVPAITPLCIVVALLLFGDRWGIFAMVWAMLAGGVVEVLAIAAMARWRGIVVLPWWHGMTDDLRAIARYYVPQMAAGVLMGGTILVDRAMASTLGPGSVSVLNFSNKLIGLITGLGTIGIGTVVLPHFSGMVARRDWAGIQDTYATYARLILLTTIPVTAAFFVFSEPIVALLFERGSFSSDDVVIVGHTQALFMLQIPFFVIGILTVRLIASLKQNDIIMWSALTNLILNVILNFVFMRYLGVAGIALATSGVYLFSSIFLYVMLRRRAPGIMAAPLNAPVPAE